MSRLAKSTEILHTATARGNARDAGGGRLEGPQVQRLRRREPQFRTVSGEVSALQELLLRRVHHGNDLKTNYTMRTCLLKGISRRAEDAFCITRRRHIFENYRSIDWHPT